jgi:hypothetical protein
LIGNGRIARYKRQSMPITKVGFHVVNLGQKRPRRVQELG